MKSGVSFVSFLSVARGSFELRLAFTSVRCAPFMIIYSLFSTWIRMAVLKSLSEAGCFTCL